MSQDPRGRFVARHELQRLRHVDASVNGKTRAIEDRTVPRLDTGPDRKTDWTFKMSAFNTLFWNHHTTDNHGICQVVWGSARRCNTIHKEFKPCDPWILILGTSQRKCAAGNSNYKPSRVQLVKIRGLII